MTNADDTYTVQVFDADRLEFQAATIEECWIWINANVGLGVLYEIFDADDRLVEQDRGVF